MSALANDLEAGFEILWYKIESVLGRGGFGITYLAMDTNLGQQVAIKEYLPHDFAARSGDSTVQPASEEQEDMYSWGLERFMSEAQTLAKFKHHNIVRVLSVFKHNNTGYMVMEYEQGRPLNDIYKEKKTLTQQELENIYYPIIDGLAAVHKEGFIHRDIKPANIFIRDDGSPVLLDFGAARQAIGGKTKTLTSMLSIGYAPFEQYNDGSGKQGPWTDVYAIGACLHQGITGQKPSESTIRGMALLHDEADPYEPLSHRKIENYSAEFARAIDQALMLQIHDRPQTLEEFMGMLKGELQLPPIPPRKNKDKTGINDHTVIRQVKGAFHGTEVSITDDIPTEKVAITEVLDAEGLPLEDEADGVDIELASEGPRSTKTRGNLAKHKNKILAGVAAIIVLAILAITLTPGEKTPVDIQQEKIAGLLNEAEDYYDAGVYIGEDNKNALTRYKEVLMLDAQNQAAKNGLNKTGNQLLQLAENAIAAKDYVKADSLLKTTASIDSAFPGLKAIQNNLAELVKSEKRFKQLDIMLGNAQRALDRGQVYQPKDKSAYAYYQQVLTVDPENITATLGLSEVSDQIIMDARNTLREKNIAETNRLISLAESISPNKPAITDIKQQLASSSALSDLITRADNAYKRQQYTTPAENNAVDLYNQVLELSPNEANAVSRLEKMADFYANKASSQIRAGNLASARKNVTTLETHFPDFSGISRLKTDLSQKQKQLSAKKADPLKGIRSLIPAGINQKQSDDVVVQDIVEQFLTHFKNRDLTRLKKVTRLSPQQEALYSGLFKLYKSLNLKLEPQSFTVNKNKGIAGVKFIITDLVDKNGNSVQTSANWTRLNVSMTKNSGVWLKAQIK